VTFVSYTMNTTFRFACFAVVFGLFAAAGSGGLSAAFASEAREADWAIHDGKLYVDGRWVFLKIGKPLRVFSDPKVCQKLAEDLPTLKAKGYNALELNCYWHHFDKDGDGTIDVSLEPLAGLIEAIHAQGMFPCLSVETYGVGGGQVPPAFWERHPDAVAVNADDKKVSDIEYKTNAIVPSILHPGYRAAVHAFIKALVTGLPHRSILFYETTVEPQFMGHQDLDYSESAKQAYAAWLAKSGIQGPAWPETFPVPEEFRAHPVWLRFRAESLADWVNQDAAAFRAAAGSDAYIAVDYLETCGGEMPRRNGNSVQFLEALTCADIIQVNWHWRSHTKEPNECAYRNVQDVMKRLKRRWAVSEHMTLNGSDFTPDQVPTILRNALEQGTGFGWDFVNVTASTADPFALYNDDWSPKPLMAEVDDHWPKWQKEIAAKPVRPGAHPTPPPTLANVAYGPHPKQLLDFWKAPAATAEKPAPLLFYIHGGGWRGGDRSHVGAMLKPMLENGVSVVSISYRFTPEAEADKVEPPVKGPLMDAARALQTVRSKAAEWHIDKRRVAAAGLSAGGCTSLWLAFHDDMADPDSPDPIARESTRLTAALVHAAQTSLDPAQMKEWIPNSGYGGHAFGYGSFNTFLADREKILPWINEYSPYALVTPDDAPVHLSYKLAPDVGKEQQDPTHSANFGVKLKERLDEVGVRCVLVHADNKDTNPPSGNDFLLSLFDVK
jgi:acetyl esterase/lipase